MNKIENVNFKNFEDNFGNLLHEFEVIKYYKDANEKWIKEEIKQSGKSYYIVDGKLYYRCGSSLLEMNMDFNSETCGACYQIGEELLHPRKIINDEILFVYKPVNEYEEEVSLKRQSYSNNTCFYTLEGNNSITHYAENDLKNIISQLQNSIEVDKNIMTEDMEISFIKDSINNWRNKLIKLTMQFI